MSTSHDNDNESLSAATPATINVPGKSLSLIHVRETVRDKIFPRAKFLRLEDLEYSLKKHSWCQKMGSWCQIEPNKLHLWWQIAKKVILQELGQQRSNKTNVMKNEFFGNTMYLLSIFFSLFQLTVFFFFQTGWMTAGAEKSIPPTTSGKRKKGKRGLAQAKDDNDIKYSPPVELKDLCDLRGDVAAFETLTNHFLQPTYSKKWNEKVKYSTKTIQVLGDILTITDEAFVLLVLENNWERWIDINNQSNNHFQMSKRGRSKPILSTIMPKYTHLNVKEAGVRKDDSDEEDTAVWKGWNEAGIRRYNELCLIVKDNRAKHKNVDKLVLDKMKSIIRPKRAKKRPKLTAAAIKPFVEEEDSDNDSADDRNSETESVGDESEDENN